MIIRNGDVIAGIGLCGCGHGRYKNSRKFMADYLKSKDMGYKDDLSTSLSTDTSPFFEIAPTTGITMLNEQEEPGGVLLFAPCCHQACDTIENVDKGSFFLAFGLVAYPVDNLAFSY